MGLWLSKIIVQIKNESVTLKILEHVLNTQYIFRNPEKQLQ